jgi:uncharacterized protein (TIGR00369 family)
VYHARSAQAGARANQEETVAESPRDSAITPKTLADALGGGAILDIDGESGSAALAFTARPDFCHNGGVVQGGFVTGWIDSAMAHAVIARTGGSAWPATLEIKVSFLLPVLPGTETRAEGWIERQGKSIVFLGGRLLDANGEVLATATSTAKLLPLRRGGPPG